MNKRLLSTAWSISKMFAKFDPCALPDSICVCEKTEPTSIRIWSALFAPAVARIPTAQQPNQSEGEAPCGKD